MISKEYKEQLLELRRGRRWGASAHKHASKVLSFAEEVGAKSVLDYGAGEQTLKDVVDLEYYAYDPAVPEIDKRPLPECDIVVALDVLEHVEPIYTQAVLEDIWKQARFGVLLYIPIKEACAILPDGRNAHINIQSPQEWLVQIGALPTNRIKAEYDDRAIIIYAYTTFTKRD